MIAPRQSSATANAPITRGQVSRKKAAASNDAATSADLQLPICIFHVKTLRHAVELVQNPEKPAQPFERLLVGPVFRIVMNRHGHDLLELLVGKSEPLLDHFKNFGLQPRWLGHQRSTRGPPHLS